MREGSGVNQVKGVFMRIIMQGRLLVAFERIMLIKGFLKIPCGFESLIRAVFSVVPKLHYWRFRYLGAGTMLEQC